MLIFGIPGFFSKSTNCPNLSAEQLSYSEINERQESRRVLMGQMKKHLKYNNKEHILVPILPSLVEAMESFVIFTDLKRKVTPRGDDVGKNDTVRSIFQKALISNSSISISNAMESFSLKGCESDFASFEKSFGLRNALFKSAQAIEQVLFLDLCSSCQKNATVSATYSNFLVSDAPNCPPLDKANTSRSESKCPVKQEGNEYDVVARFLRMEFRMFLGDAVFEGLVLWICSLEVPFDKKVVDAIKNVRQAVFRLGETLDLHSKSDYITRDSWGNIKVCSATVEDVFNQVLKSKYFDQIIDACFLREKQLIEQGKTREAFQVLLLKQSVQRLKEAVEITLAVANNKEFGKHFYKS